MYTQNVGYFDIIEGTHRFTEDDILIQILDPGIDFPKPFHPFKEIHQFQFADVEKEDDAAWENRITDEQAKDLVKIIEDTHRKGQNIIVQCFAGSCRSGAVVEVALAFGYTDLQEYRKPNEYVMLKLIDATLNRFK